MAADLDLHRAEAEHLAGGELGGTAHRRTAAPGPVARAEVGHHDPAAGADGDGGMAARHRRVLQHDVARGRPTDGGATGGQRVAPAGAEAAHHGQLVRSARWLLARPRPAARPVVQVHDGAGGEAGVGEQDVAGPHPTSPAQAGAGRGSRCQGVDQVAHRGARVADLYGELPLPSAVVDHQVHATSPRRCNELY